MNISETVIEYWPELHRGWKLGISIAIRHYSKPENRQEFEDDILGVQKEREFSKPKAHRQIKLPSELLLEQLAREEICMLAGEGYSIEEIQQITQSIAEIVSGIEGDYWARRSILRQLDSGTRAALEAKEQAQELPEP